MYLAYHKRGEEKLFLASSEDYCNWQETPLVLESKVGSQKIRDPFLFYDQKFHLLYTDGFSSRNFCYTSSDDLKSWHKQFSYPMRNTGSVTTWAPECIKCDNHYKIIASVATRYKQGYEKRIWSIETKDFRNFGKAILLFDPGYEVIDANIVRFQGRYVMAFKDEVNKIIKICTSNYIDGPYKNITEGITEKDTEGPCMFIYKSQLYMIYDNYKENKLKMIKTEDLIDWEQVETNFPQDASHPSLCQV